jgi:hypothetical protein
MVRFDKMGGEGALCMHFCVWSKGDVEVFLLLFAELTCW